MAKGFTHTPKANEFIIVKKKKEEEEEEGNQASYFIGLTQCLQWISCFLLFLFLQNKQDEQVFTKNSEMNGFFFHKMNHPSKELPLFFIVTIYIILIVDKLFYIYRKSK